MQTEASIREEEISSLLEVEGEIVGFMRLLHSKTPLCYAQASDQFTMIHAHAAWTDLAPLASIADVVWSKLTPADTGAQMSLDERAFVRKQMMTYKFLLHRLMGDYQDEIDAAMAS
ncbi:hypothetical protein [Hirschia litorea]|uniref:Uncharacterized protein n=1 Tax=Hirschia litorea TaxID=1199156 RepID=A0ABW2IMT4_9PROT